MLLLIRAPPQVCHSPLVTLTEPEDKALAEAWTLLCTKIKPEFAAAPTWTHKLIREQWAAADIKVARSRREVAPWVPEVFVAETPGRDVVAADGTSKHIPGSVRFMVNDVFAYDVEAQILPPHTVKIWGNHIYPTLDELPPGTEVRGSCPEGRFTVTERCKRTLDATRPARVVVMGCWYAVQCRLLPEFSAPSGPAQKKQKQATLLTFLKDDFDEATSSNAVVDNPVVVDDQELDLDP